MRSSIPDYIDWYQGDNLFAVKFGDAALKHTFETKIERPEHTAPKHKIKVERVEYHGIREQRIHVKVQAFARGRGALDPNFRCRATMAIFPVFRDGSVKFEVRRHGKIDCDRNILFDLLDGIFLGSLGGFISRVLTGDGFFENIFESVLDHLSTGVLTKPEFNVVEVVPAVREMEKTGLIRLENVWAGKGNRPSVGLWMDFGLRVPDFGKIEDIAKKHGWNI
jgi:hypothetical protein